ncbi:hypothetical protein B0H14DRAFT_2882994 [Mycena olivaceomarginata]|nr:hypothetical protein B0H14DRAFT_2882994 [Mycena olivaceomarginata]
MSNTADNYKIPAGLNDHFCHPLDAADDFMAAFERAVAFSAILGDDSGRGAMEIAPKREEFDDYSFGHDEGVKEGRMSGLRDGKKEGRKAGKAQGLKEGEIVGFERGLSEGKRLGFVAGREFGEKQTAKLSKPLASKHILVDAGTDSPLTELLLTPAPLTVTYASASAQTVAQYDAVPPILGNTPCLIWADEPSDVRISERINSQRLPPRNLSVLCSDSTSSKPFATLRYCAHRTQKSPWRTHRSATATRPHAIRGSIPSALKPSTADTNSFLDWDHDPRLSA